MSDSIVIIFNNYFIQAKFNKDNFNFTLGIFNIDTNIAYNCTFNHANITIQNSSIAGIYKILTNALDKKEGFTIDFFLCNFNIVLNYSNDIFTFGQTIQLFQADSISYRQDYKLYLMKMENEKILSELDVLKKNSIGIEKYSQLVNQNEKILSELNNLKIELEKIKSNMVAPSIFDSPPNTSTLSIILNNPNQVHASTKSDSVETNNKVVQEPDKVQEKEPGSNINSNPTPTQSLGIPSTPVISGISDKKTSIEEKN
jgi:uncharacterized protein YqfB (UPF0267 family)